jgi:hypothetical protein
MRREIETALSSIADKYNCEVHAGGIKYTNVSATVSVEFNAKGAEGISAEQNLFNTYCAQFGFKPEDYNRIVSIDGKLYRLIGFNLKARKNFCLITRDGKQYACPLETVRGR